MILSILDTVPSYDLGLKEKESGTDILEMFGLKRYGHAPANRLPSVLFGSIRKLDLRVKERIAEGA